MKFNFIEVYNNSVIERIQCFGTLFFGWTRSQNTVFVQWPIIITKMGLRNIQGIMVSNLLLSKRHNVVFLLANQSSIHTNKLAIICLVFCELFIVSDTYVCGAFNSHEQRHRELVEGGREREGREGERVREGGRHHTIREKVSLYGRCGSEWTWTLKTGFSVSVCISWVWYTDTILWFCHFCVHVCLGWEFPAAGRGSVFERKGVKLMFCLGV